MKTQSILGITISNATEQDILEYVFKTLLKQEKKSYIVTPNPEMLVYARKHFSFKTILNQATIALPDGVGVMIAGRLLGKPLKQRITGIDFMKNLCKESVREAVTIGLIGAGAGVADEAADCLRKTYPGINIVLVADEWPTNLESPVSHIDLLFVAFGHPKQEEWIAANLENLPVKVAMGVGGAFDYLSGEVVRAPKIVRSLGFEWLFRLIRQPWRLKRQLALPVFLYFVLTERLQQKNR